MAGFTVDGVAYDLVTLDNIEDLSLGELEVLEDVGGVSLNAITDDSGVLVTTKLVLALVLVSMQRANPAASVTDARKVKLSVLGELAGDVANASVDADPPTVPAAPGAPA